MKFYSRRAEMAKNTLDGAAGFITERGFEAEAPQVQAHEEDHAGDESGKCH